MNNLEIAKTIALNLESNGLLDSETKELSVYESVLEGLLWGLEKAEKRGAEKYKEKLAIAVEALRVCSKPVTFAYGTKTAREALEKIGGSE